MINRLSFQAETACLWEATARKVGNVHPNASFADVQYMHFALSASLLGSTLARLPANASVGTTILASVDAIRTEVGTNTNLGIILLLVPLAHVPLTVSLQEGLPGVLDSLTVEDARLTYEAIRLANPGGLGDAPEQDVKQEPTITLLEAMKLGQDRDQIARQYATHYHDILSFGVPAFLKSLERHSCVEAAVIDCQLQWLRRFPDSLIARKLGADRAEQVRIQAERVCALGGLDTPEGRKAGVELDRHLRSEGNRLNPGTTADLVTACLFVALRENRVRASAAFRWNVADWL